MSLDVQPAAPEQFRRWRRLLTYAAIALVVLIGAAILGRRSDDTPTLASRIGTACAFDAALGVAQSAALSAEFTEAMRQKDAGNMAALVRSNQVLLVMSGGRARVLDSSFTNSALRVRIIDGPGLGAEGWIYHAFCQ